MVTLARLFQRIANFGPMILAPAFASGCILTAVEDPEEGPTGEVEQAATILGEVELAAFGGAVDSSPLGSASNRTCFLNGVRGNLKGQDLYPGNPIAKIGLRIDGNNQWILHGNAGIGTGVRANATCVTNVANRVPMAVSECTSFSCSWQNVPASAFPKRRCFVTDIWSRAGMIHQYPGDSRPGIKVDKQGAVGSQIWVLKAWSSDDPSEYANIGGGVHCVDFEGGSADGSWDGPGNVPMCGGSTTVGVFRGIFGLFTGNSFDGVLLRRNANTQNVDLIVNGAKKVDVTCTG